MLSCLRTMSVEPARRLTTETFVVVLAPTLVQKWKVTAQRPMALDHDTVNDGSSVKQATTQDASNVKRTRNWGNWAPWSRHTSLPRSLARRAEASGCLSTMVTRLFPSGLIAPGRIQEENLQTERYQAALHANAYPQSASPPQPALNIVSMQDPATTMRESGVQLKCIWRGWFRVKIFIASAEHLRGVPNGSSVKGSVQILFPSLLSAFGSRVVNLFAVL